MKPPLRHTRDLSFVTALLASGIIGLACFGERQPLVEAPLLEAPFGEVIPSCETISWLMEPTLETTNRDQYYRNRGSVHHQRICALDDVTIKISVEVYETEQSAKHYLDQLVNDLMEHDETSMAEFMAPSSIRVRITEPAWIDTPVTWYTGGEKSAQGIGISLRVGRYHASVVVEQSKKLWADRELLYDTINQLIEGLHPLAVTEGLIPSLSSKQSIQMVTDHIEQGEPIRYTEQRELIERPLNCDDLLKESAKDFINPSSPSSTSNPTFEKTSSFGKYVEECISEPYEAWEEAGKPTFEYEWREDKECWEWDRWIGKDIEGFNPFRLDINYFHWEAQFSGPEEIEKQQAANEKMFKEYRTKDDPGWELAPHFYEYLEAISKPHWWVDGAPPDDNGCSWIVREGEGVIYATSR